MNVTTQDLERQVAALHEQRVLGGLRSIVKEHGQGQINLSMLVAIASRETNCENIEGDFGHGKGMFQIDNRFHADWLRAHPGCPSGTNEPREGHSAIDSGFVPRIGAGAIAALAILTANYGAALRAGLRFPRWVAVSGYNAGLGGALSGARSGDPDAFTTGRDYGRDVLERAHVLHQVFKTVP